MTAIFTPSAIAPGSWTNGLSATLQRWWLAYSRRRMEQAAVAALGSLSDRELQDIGICRCEIEDAVIAGRPHRAFGLNHRMG